MTDLTDADLDILDDKIRDRILQSYSAGMPTKQSSINIALDVKSSLMARLRRMQRENEKLRAALEKAEAWLDAEDSWLASEMGTTDDRDLSKASVAAREAFRSALAAARGAPTTTTGSREGKEG